MNLRLGAARTAVDERMALRESWRVNLEPRDFNGAIAVTMTPRGIYNGMTDLGFLTCALIARTNV